MQGDEGAAVCVGRRAGVEVGLERVQGEGWGADADGVGGVGLELHLVGYGVAPVEVVEETGEAAEVGRVDELRKGEAEEGSGKAVLGDLVRDVQVVDVLVGAERVEGVRRHAEDGEPVVLKKNRGWCAPSARAGRL